MVAGIVISAIDSRKSHIVLLTINFKPAKGNHMPLTTESATRKDKRSAKYPRMDAMQHRHFAVIAGIIASMPNHAATLRTAERSVALQFADALTGSNQRFDRGRFLRACGEELDL